MEYDVFISYSRRDAQIADKVCHALENAGLSVFIDRQGIKGGQEFPVVLADAICDSELFLFLASTNSYESKFTNSEITFAFNEKSHEKIIPYVIDHSTLPRHLRFVFSSIHWRNIDDHPIEPVLVDDIFYLLGKKRKEKTSGEPSTILEEKPSYEWNPDDDFQMAYAAWQNQKYETAFPVFLRLAKSGYTQAYGYVGLCYELGEGVSRDFEQMLFYYQKAIDAKEYLGVYRLGMYYTKNGNYAESRALYERCIQEGWGSGDTFYKLGCLYEYGQGGKIDLQKAIEYYRIAQQTTYAKREATEALARLGIYDEVQLPENVLQFNAKKLYELGKKNSNHNGNDALAFAYFRASAEKGNPIAAQRVVEAHDEYGSPLDEKTIEQYRDLATREMINYLKIDNSEAFHVGYAYHYGVGCRKDMLAAETCYRIGAQNGSASCNWKLGIIAEHKGQLQEAFRYYLAGSEGGHGCAMYELGRCYEMGIGTTKDIEKARQWYLASSESNYSSAHDAKTRLLMLSD